MALSNPFGPGSGKGRKTGSSIGGAVGAAAGAIGGPLAPITSPVGSAIGSALGGIVGGAFSSEDKKKKSKKVKASFDYARNLPSQGGQNFARGGMLPVTTPEGRLQGPSHEQGGIPLPGGAEAEGGETIDQIDLQSYIFSDRVNVPGTNKTFADVHEKMKQEGAPEIQIKKLAAQQEKATGRTSNPNSSTSGKMATGGFVDTGPPLAGPGAGKNFSPYYNPVTGEGLNPQSGPTGEVETSGGTRSAPVKRDPKSTPGGEGMFNQKSTAEEFPFASMGGPSKVPVASPEPMSPSPAPGDGAMVDMGTNDLAGVNSNENVEAAPASSGGGSSGGGFSAGGALSTAAQFLPAALNAARGAFGNSDVGEPQLATVSDRNVDTLRRIDTDVDVSDQMNAIDQGLRNIVTTPGVSEAGKQSAFAKSLKQKRKTLAQARREEQRMKNQKAQAVSRAQSRNDKTRTKINQQARARNRQLQLKADAAKSNMLSKGIGQFSQTMARRKANSQTRQRSTTAIMASLAGMDDATKRKELNAIIPTLPEGQQKQALQQILSSL